MRTVPVALSGLGSVHRHLLTIFETKRARLAAQHALDLRVVWVADSTAIRCEPQGFHPRELEEFKTNGGRLRDSDLGELLTDDPAGASRAFSIH